MLGSSSEITIRKGRVADAAALADVFRESWSLAYRGIIPHLHLSSMIERRGSDWWLGALRTGEGVLVLDVAGTIAGYVTSGASRTRGAYEGEIYEIYVLPTHQGLGFGEHLFEAARHSLDMRKLKGLIVWCLADNEPAIDFYWRRGGRPVARTIERLGGSKLEKLGFGWS